MRLATRTARGTALFAVPLVAIALLTAALASPANERIVVNFFITLVLVLAIQLFSGNSGIVSFGHIGFMGVGAYVGALLTIPPVLKQTILPSLPNWLIELQLGFLPSILVAAAVAGVVAGVLGLPLARMQEGAMAMATIGVLVIFFVVFDSWDSVTRGATGLFGIPQQTTIFSAVGFAILALAVSRAFRESRVGVKVRASRADPVAAEALGANVVRVRWLAWTLSGVLMGMGGGLWAEFNLAFGPRQFFFAQTFNVLAMLVVGGLASTSGAVAGAAIITVAFELLRRMEEATAIQGLTQIAVAVLILAVLYRRPEGLFGRFEADDAIARRLAGFRRVGPPPAERPLLEPEKERRTP